MTLENIIASIAGAGTAAATYYKRGVFITAHVFFTSFCVAVYGGPDLIKLVFAATGFALSQGVAHFLMAYYGASVLDYIGGNLKGLIIKWKP